jgi:glycosyltransferase involved in cell wall biosynthesis
MTKSTVVVIIPAFNESAYIAKVLQAVKKTGFRFLVVDDGSSDDTAKISKRFCDHVLVHRVNLGKGAALKTGCEYAFDTLRAQAVIFMDSDAQHNPAELNLFFEKLKAGAQVVFGVRSFDATMPWIKITSNRLASVTVRWLYGTYIPDIPSGYKALTKWAYSRVKWNSRDYRVELEIAVNVAKRRIPFTTVPVQTIYLDFNRGFHLLDALQMGFDLISWRFTK